MVSVLDIYYASKASRGSTEGSIPPRATAYDAVFVNCGSQKMLQILCGPLGLSLRANIKGLLFASSSSGTGAPTPFLQLSLILLPALEAFASKPLLHNVISPLRFPSIAFFSTSHL